MTRTKVTACEMEVGEETAWKITFSSKWLILSFLKKKQDWEKKKWVKLCPAILPTWSHNPFYKHTELCLISGEVFLPPLTPKKLFLNLSDLIIKNFHLSPDWIFHHQFALLCDVIVCQPRCCWTFLQGLLVSAVSSWGPWIPGPQTGLDTRNVTLVSFTGAIWLEWQSKALAKCWINDKKCNSSARRIWMWLAKYFFLCLCSAVLRFHLSFSQLRQVSSLWSTNRSKSFHLFFYR